MFRYCETDEAYNPFTDDEITDGGDDESKKPQAATGKRPRTTRDFARNHPRGNYCSLQNFFCNSKDHLRSNVRLISLISMGTKAYIICSHY